VIRRAAASLPLAIVALDVAVVGVLLPDVRLDLGSSASGAQWVLNAYLLAAAVVLLLPRRAPVAAGVLALAAGAVVCATADSTAALVAGRAVEGAGAGALLAGAALPQLVLPALALALGPLLGGVLAQENWWHLYFWAGVPLAAAAGAGALAGPGAARQAGAAPDSPLRPAAFAVGLVAVVVVLVQAEPWGLSWPALALAAAALGVALRRVPGTLFAWAVLAGCLTALLFLMPEYFQLVRNLSGSRSGILLLALTLPTVTVAMVGKWLPPLGVAGPICAVAGLALLVTIEPHSGYALLIVALGLVGTGLGAAASGLRGAGLGPVVAGAALGLAVAGAGFQLEQADQRDSGATFQEAFAAGVSWAAVLLLALVAAAAFAVWQERRARDGATRASSGARPAAES
jgi:MFS transporter, DHA2 family, methylenomycin A resistance protein